MGKQGTKEWLSVHFDKRNYTVAFAPISNNLVSMVEVLDDVIVLRVHHTNRRSSLLRLYSKGEFRSGKVNRDLILELTLDLWRGHENVDTEAVVAQLVTDRRFGVILDGVKEWFEFTGNAITDYTETVRIRNDSSILVHMLDTGFSAFLDDETVSLARRALVLLSVFDGGTWDRSASDEDRVLSVRHLSIGLARRIADTVDLSALGSTGTAYADGFRLCRPLIEGGYGKDSSSGSWGGVSDSAWLYSWAEDDKYKLFSVLLSRSVDSHASSAAGWVAPMIRDTNPMRNLCSAMSGALAEGIPVTDELLERIDRIPDDVFPEFQKVLIWSLGEVRYVCETLSATASRMLKVALFDFLLDSYESNPVGIVEFAENLRSGDYLDSLGSHGGLTAGCVKSCQESLSAPDPISISLIKAVVAASMVSKYPSSPGLSDAVLSWFEFEFDPWDLFGFHSDLIAYLDALEGGEVGPEIAFSWWRALCRQQEVEQKEDPLYLPF